MLTYADVCWRMEVIKVESLPGTRHPTLKTEKNYGKFNQNIGGSSGLWKVFQVKDGKRGRSGLRQRNLNHTENQVIIKMFLDWLRRSMILTPTTLSWLSRSRLIVILVFLLSPSPDTSSLILFREKVLWWNGFITMFLFNSHGGTSFFLGGVSSSVLVIL